MAASAKSRAMKYLECIDDSDNKTTRTPLRPTSKFNSSSNESPKFISSKGCDLELLSKEMNIVTPSPSKTALLRSKFESPSVTVSSFKSPLNKSSAESSRVGSPVRRHATTDEGDVTHSSKRNNGVTPISLGKLSDLAPETKSWKINSSPSKNASRDSAGYEYLCRIEETRIWLEAVLKEPVHQGAAELISYIRNGIYLAKLANAILPTRKRVFTNDSKLQFRHTENINRFFHLLEYLDVPDLFRFELTDLYDAKNVPKVWFCLRAISYMLHKLDSKFPKIINLMGSLDFSPDDVRSANRALVGTGLPNFASADETSDESSYMNSITSPTKPEQKAHASAVAQELKQKSATDAFPKEKVQIIENKDNPFIESRLTDEQARYRPDYFQEQDLQHIDVEGNYSFVDGIVKIQTLARGANFRYRMFVDRIMLRSYSEDIEKLITIIRGNQLRMKTIHKHRDELLTHGREILLLQSIAKAKVVRKNVMDLNHALEDFQFQRIVRGAMQRNFIQDLKLKLLQNEELIIRLQSYSKMKTIFSKSSVLISHRDSIESIILSFQSAARRRLYENQTCRQSIANSSNNRALTALQSVIRAHKVRLTLSLINRELQLESLSVKEFQGIVRGGIARTKLCNNFLLILFGEDASLTELCAKIKGVMVRREIEIKKRVLMKLEETSIVPLQSLFRGVLGRFEYEIKLDDAYNDIENIIVLQGLIRGATIRKNILGMNEYYEYNVDKVIKAQAFIRSKYTRKAYKALMSQKDVPLAVIRTFAYLLTDNDLDFQEEIDLVELKNMIIEKSTCNAEIEQQIENLDVKLGLLDKNKITIEDFVEHKNKIKSKTPEAVNVKNLDTLSRSSRKRIELYQSMFYFLQTKPIYLVRLYRAQARKQIESRSSDDLKSCIILLFPIKNSSIGHHSREEFFFIKFVFCLMQDDIQYNCKNISDLTKTQKCFWTEFILNFNNHTYQRLHLKSIFGKLVTKVIENDNIDFESDPSEIYNMLIKKEIKVKGFSERENDVSPQVAIKDPEVSSRFVDNLMGLREHVTDLLNLLDANIDRIPIHIRLTCNNAYMLSKIHFPGKSDSQHLAVAGVIFIKHYIASILHYPENYGYMIKDPINASLYSFRARNNLKYLSRVLLQVFSMKQFNDSFLKPLNEFVQSSIDTTRKIIQRIIDVKSLELEYGINEFDDIVKHERPQLNMKVSDMICLEKIVTRNADIVAPDFDDQLYTLLTSLNDDINSANDLMTLSELGYITLNLNPTTKEDSLADSKVISLMTQAKRSILYIIRVQEGQTLLELLVSGISEVHEKKFKDLVSNEKKESEKSKAFEKRNPYYKTSLGDLTTTSYRDLKKMCLEILLKLEAKDKLTRNNSFQDILNHIATDIKTKDAKRIGRKQQLAFARDTVNKISDKQRFLERQLNDYNEHIKSVVTELQLRPKEKKFFNIIPVFSKQYFYQRELKKSNRLPKFGAYKYSAKKLRDQNVLLDFGGLLHHAYSSSSKLDFVFSCHKVGIFTIEVVNGSVTVPGASNIISLDDLLNYQYEDQKELEMFDKMVTFDTHNLSGLIFKNFYDIKRD
ncbi:uncharacterized protein PRCAT00003733001 [Priceomyces carsonii]|uniref:uncharacterized protein n=1 Tax=Priceomyces carsonii TaxID=28549 RepID=UPI002ED821F8|nr:unnamed protein product [Priceomyces carsonii]